jgi:hypothetical protein
MGGLAHVKMPCGTEMSLFGYKETRGRLLSESGKGEGSPNWRKKRGCFLIDEGAFARRYFCAGGETEGFQTDRSCLHRNYDSATTSQHADKIGWILDYLGLEIRFSGTRGIAVDLPFSQALIPRSKSPP